MEGWHFWAILGVILWIIEIFAYPFFIIGIFGTSSLIAGAFAFAGFSFKVQLVVFCIGTLLVGYGVRPFFNGFRKYGAVQEETNAKALIEGVGVVVEKIDADKGSGVVKIGGETWKAAALGGQVIPAGERVVIKDLKGCTLFVKAKS